MNARMDGPSASLTAPGICHNIDIGGHASAGGATLDDGVPSGRVILGYLETGQPVTLVFHSLEQMGETAAAITREQGSLAMWLPRHDVHPFGEDAA